MSHDKGPSGVKVAGLHVAPQGIDQLPAALGVVAAALAACARLATACKPHDQVGWAHITSPRRAR